MKTWITALLIIKTISQSIVNIDEEAISYQLSLYLHNSTLQFHYYDKSTKSQDHLMSNDTIYTNSPYSIQLLTEKDGILVNNVAMKRNDAVLEPGFDYVIDGNIDPKVYPSNYFNQDKYHNEDTNTADIFSKCLYTNPGPQYDVGIFNNITIDRYVSFANYNFGLDKNSPGIKVIKVNNFTYLSYKLDDFIGSSLSSRTDNINFIKLFVSQPNFDYTNKNYLIALSEKQELYIWEIKDSVNNYTDFSMTYFANIPLERFNMTDFKQVDIFDGLMIIGGDEGFAVAKNTPFEIQYSESNINITNFIMNNKTAYVIDKDIGMRIFDLKNLNFTDFEFRHPSLTRFDWAYDQITSLYFVGIYVDNNPPDVNEIFIELLVNTRDDSEFDPKIN
jgi:hypothetical protein